MLRISFVIIVLMLLAGTAVNAQEPTAAPTLEPATTTTIEVETVIPPADTATPAPTLEPAAAPTVVVSTDSTRLTFQQLGFEAELLRGPFDRVTYLFSLPANWVLAAGTQAEIYLVGLDPAIDPELLSNLATLEIEFNDVLVDTFVINWKEESTLTFTIPDNATVPTRIDGRHELVFSFDASHRCTDQISGVMIDDRSVMQLAYAEAPPSTDLRLLPRPIFQRSFQPDRVLLVLPATPSESELEAAMRIVATFGRSTFGRLAVSLITADALTPALQADTNLIFVGKEAAFTHLGDDLQPPAQAAMAAANDGLLWMAVSPWNSAYVILMATGQTDEAVRKAGLALSQFEIRPADTPDLAIVTETYLDQPSTPGLAGGFSRSLRQMNIPTTVLEEIGLHEVDINFDIPAGELPGTEAFFDLDFSHSTLIDYDQSGVTLLLNGIPVGSIRLSDENASLTTLRTPLPAALMQPGQNRLTVQVELRPASECFSRDTLSNWFIIHDTSILSVLLTEMDAPVSLTPDFDLDHYPQPYISANRLENTLLILPRNNPIAWESAADLLFNLGDEADGSPYEVEVAFGDAVTPEMLAERHLILVGLPGELPQIQEWNDLLPAFFPPDSPVAVERGAAVLYEQAPDRSIGYLELIQSPAASDYQALLVLGTDNTALQNISALLSDPALRSTLTGNLAILDAGQIISHEIHLVAPIQPEFVIQPEQTAQPELGTAEPLGTDEAVEIAASANDPVENPLILVDESEGASTEDTGWIPKFMMLSSALMVGIVGFVLVTTAVRSFRTGDQRGEDKPLTLSLPFAVEWLDYRHHSNIQADLDNILATDPSAIIWAEGFPSDKSPGKPRHELIPAESLVVLTAPPNRAILEEGIRIVRPRRVYMVADMPLVDTLPEFVKALRRMAEVVITRGLDGRVDINLMSERMAQPISTIKLGLEYLEALGVLEVEFGDTSFVAIRTGTNKPQDRRAKIALNRLEKVWEQVADYRRELRRVKLPGQNESA